MCWLGFNFITPHNSFTNLECWSWEARERCEKAFGWCGMRQFGKQENFSTIKIKEVGEMVDEITVLSWRWGFARLKCTPCLFYVWC